MPRAGPGGQGARHRIQDAPPALQTVKVCGVESEDTPTQKKNDASREKERETARGKKRRKEHHEVTETKDTETEYSQVQLPQSPDTVHEVDPQGLRGKEPTPGISHRCKGICSRFVGCLACKSTHCVPSALACCKQGNCCAARWPATATHIPHYL